MSPLPQDIFSAIGGSLSASDLRTHLERSLRRLGFDSFEYYWFTLSAEGVVLYSLVNEGSSRSRRRLWLDPFVQHCRIAYTPVVWQALAPDACIRQVLTWAPWKGLPIRVHTGVAIPVHGPDGGFGLLNLRVASDRTDAVPPESVHGAHVRALAVYETVLKHRDDRRFGLTCDVVETEDRLRVPYGSIEKSRVQPAVKH